MENEKMKIGIDIDDTIISFYKEFAEFCEINLNKKFSVEEISHFNIWKVLDISREEVVEMAKKFNEEGLFLKLDFIEGSKEAINELSKNNNLFFITSRPFEAKEGTLNFFEEHFPEINFNIIFSEKPNGNEKSKAQICKELGIKILIEDRRKYALDCAENGIKVLLMNKPWNQNCGHENIIRVNNWNEILEELGWKIKIL